MRSIRVLLISVALALVVQGLAEAAVILVDNDDPEVSYTGTWPTSTFSSDRIGPNYQHSNRVGGLTATYTPALPETGMYLVEAFWNASAQRGSDVNYTINYNGGVGNAVYDQRTDGNQWNSLGLYPFAAGSAGNVVISSTVSNNEYVIADAIRFTSIESAEPGESVILDAQADAYIQGSGGNHGTGQTLLIKSDGSTVNWSRKTYIRFDLAMLTFDHTTDLGGAQLLLNFIESGVGGENDNETYEFELYGLIDGDPGENWSETGITWANAPANDTTSYDGMLANALSLGVFELQGKGIGVLELSSDELDAFVASSTVNDLLTFMVVRHTPQLGPDGVGDDYAHALASWENADFTGSQLVVVRYIPEPATLALLGLGALGLRRRRRA